MANGSDNTLYTHYIAIDFGTSGCGIVMSTDVSEKPRLFSKWVPGQVGIAIKCPTVMLLDHNGKCEAFGLKARVNYNKNCVKHSEEFKNYSLFEHFKMKLYEEKNITHGLMIQAVNGRKLPAVTVFSEALGYMKKTILSELDAQVVHPNRAILWILTVPAIWSSAAKQVMRIAAENAGFCSDNNSLKFALEPEAASLYCLDEKEDDILSAASGQHLVVDCGGGTVDIAAHKWIKVPLEKKVYAEEIHKVHGGPCGSYAINAEFEKLLIEIFKLDITDLRKVCGSHWSKMIYDNFEKEKCSFVIGNDKISVPVPIKVFEYIEKLSGRSMSQLLNEYTQYNIEWDESYEALVLPSELMCSLFDLIVNQVIHVIDDVLKAPECSLIKKVLMVGGFSQSSILVNAVRKHFSSRLSVCIGTTPIFSVLYGAVKFGRHRNLIRSRIMCQTVGVETWDDFKPGEHDEGRKYTDANGKSYCKHVFTELVQIGQSISTQTPISKKYVFTPILNDKKICCLNIYSSYEKEPKYIDDICSYLVGTLILTDLPDEASQQVAVLMDFRGTEITVTATNNATHQHLPLKLDWIKDKYVT